MRKMLYKMKLQRLSWRQLDFLLSSWRHFIFHPKSFFSSKKWWWVSDGHIWRHLPLSQKASVSSNQNVSLFTCEYVHLCWWAGPPMLYYASAEWAVLCKGLGTPHSIAQHTQFSLFLCVLSLGWNSFCPRVFPGHRVPACYAWRTLFCFSHELAT